MTKENKILCLKINVVFSWDFYIMIKYFMDIKNYSLQNGYFPHTWPSMTKEWKKWREMGITNGIKKDRNISKEPYWIIK